MGCSPSDLRTGSFGRPMGFGRPSRRTSETCRKSDSGGEVSWIGSSSRGPSCRTSVICRTPDASGVRILSEIRLRFWRSSGYGGRQMSDVRIVSDVRCPESCPYHREVQLLLLDPWLCLGCPHHHPLLQKASTSTIYGRRSTFAASKNTGCAEEQHQSQTLVQVMDRYELQCADETH